MPEIPKVVRLQVMAEAGDRACILSYKLYGLPKIGIHRLSEVRLGRETMKRDRVEFALQIQNFDSLRNAIEHVLTNLATAIY